MSKEKKDLWEVFQGRSSEENLAFIEELIHVWIFNILYTEMIPDCAIEKYLTLKMLKEEFQLEG